MLANNMNRVLHGLKLALFVYVLLLVTNFTVSVDVRCIDRERLALLELKQGFVDLNGRFSTWGDGEHEKECCNWTDVHCSDNTNHVISLDLNGPYDDEDSFLPIQPLQDIVAPSLGKLDHLTYLDLSYNNFNGTEIPKFIGSLIHLRYLNLSHSYFGGTIPQQLGNLSHLKYLDFGHNYFLNGVIPNSLGNLSRLEYLDFHDNDLSGVIPNSLGNLSKLLYLDFGYNYQPFVDEVPKNLENIASLEYDNTWNSQNLASNLEWLRNLTSLQTLSLSDVDFGTVDTWAKLVTDNLTQLKMLILSDCNLVGNIPEQIGSLSQLQYLDLSRNSFTGIIPHQIGNLSQLEYLRLSYNKLHGYIPNQLGNLCHLRLLELGLNNLNGQLEDFLIDTMERTPRCLHQSLQILNLRSNQFTGSIPDLSFFLELQFLYLSHNKLNGTLSDGMGQLSNLEHLDIGSNPLQDMISEDHFSKLSSLVYLDMSNTSLSFNISKGWIPPFQLHSLELDYCKVGPYVPEWLKNQRYLRRFSLHHSEIVDVPDWFWIGNPYMENLDLSYNNIQGEIADLPVKFSTFSYIDLSANQLRGEIPPFLFQAEALNLSTNMFSGSICSMTHSSLRFLDISHNQLSEELPANCWLHFEQLVYLDLSFNNFSGKVPASLFSLPNLHALHLQNNKFQSIPSLSSSNLTSLRSLDLSDNKISGIIPSWIGDEVLNLSVLSLRNNNFYGSLPFNICNLTHIVVFDLSTNHLSGSIPKCLNHFIALSNNSNLVIDLTYHYNVVDDIGISNFRSYIDSIAITWKGKLAKYQNILILQRLIDLSNNQLTGEIPDEIMDLVQLHSLNLSCNKLGGEIDPKIGQLQNLDSLDLSRNLLCGRIPPSITQLNFLAQLNLSFNNLSGKIPTGSQLQTLNDASIYSGNPDLCGPPLDRLCPNDKNDNGKSNSIYQGEDDNEDLLEMYGFYIFMACGFIAGFLTSCGSLIFCKAWRYIIFNLCTSICDNVYVKMRISVNKLRLRLDV